MVFMSAWIPAPPTESLPAMVSIYFSPSINFNLQICAVQKIERIEIPKSALPDWSTGLISAYYFQHPNNMFYCPTMKVKRCKGNNNLDSMI
jgi:hypothetical protein